MYFVTTFFTLLQQFIFIGLCFITLITRAQDGHFKGRISHGEDPLEAAHILNLTRQLQTISNAEGSFEIEASTGDTLIISHLGYQQMSFKITEEQLSGERILIHMIPDGIPLEEVTVETNRALDPVALGLINKRPKQLSTNERKLEEAGDFKAVQLLGIIGGGVPIIPMINKITGRTKRLKERVAVENENKLKDYLQYHYAAFCKKSLHLEGPAIDRFLYYAVVNGQWDDLYPNGKKERFQFRLIQLHEKFLASLDEAKE